MSSEQDIQRARIWTRVVWIVVAIIALIGMLPLYVQADTGFVDQQPYAWASKYASEMAPEIGVPSEPTVSVVHFGSTSQRGQSFVSRRGGVMGYHVQLSKRHVRQNRGYVYATIRHELCHLATFAKLGTTKEGGKFHGPTFEKCAKAWNVGNDYVRD
jgi:hypothetical protein